MTSSLTLERVRRDVEVVARAGLDLETFLEEAVASVARAVPWTSACLATQDPGTLLLTGASKYGDLRHRDSHDHEWGLQEYGHPEPSSFAELAHAPGPAVGMHAQTQGDVEQSGRMRRLMVPRFGYTDEARLSFRDAGQVWGGMALFRGADERPFDEAEIEFLAALSADFARGVRGGVLCRLAGPVPPLAPEGPAVVIVGPDNQFVQMSAGAERRIADLAASEAATDPLSAVSALVGAARRYARGETAVPPRSRVRGASGLWLVLHASPLSATSDRDGDVVVTIEEARPPEIVALVVAAFGLTPRERDVTQLVLQGVDTKEIASALRVSTYTVQDHLKSVFDKADVRSRRELIARIYFDQYVPRMGSELSPAGWFAS